jgi:hypothetical protein
VVATKTTEVARVTVILAQLKITIREAETNNNLIITKILREEITATTEVAIKREISTKRRTIKLLAATVQLSKSSPKSYLKSARLTFRQSLSPSSQITALLLLNLRKEKSRRKKSEISKLLLRSTTRQNLRLEVRLLMKTLSTTS